MEFPACSRSGLKPQPSPTGFPEYHLDKGILFKGEKICVPLSYREKVLKEAHDSPSGGHPGGRRTYLAVRANFYWPNMKQEIEDYARTCDTCQKNKPDNQQKRGLLHPLPAPSKAWEHISMDFVTKLSRTARGHSAILVVVDRLSKQAHLIPTRDEATAAQTAQIFLDRIYSQHGMPLSIVSDRDSKFTAHF